MPIKGQGEKFAFLKLFKSINIWKYFGQNILSKKCYSLQNNLSI